MIDIASRWIFVLGMCLILLYIFHDFYNDGSGGFEAGFGI